MVIATNNKDKLREFRNILREYQIYSLKDKNINIDVVEDGETFLDNAKKKALAIYDIVHEEVIADDSGLCIDVLNGYPGVNTHRFLGIHTTDEVRNQYLLKEVNKYDDRSAKVVCSLVYYDGKDMITSEGILEGKIADEARGENGFGFDSIFEIPCGFTLAELGEDAKNIVSARGEAIKELKKKIER